MNSELIIAQVKDWVQSFVVELNICPFAGRELASERIRFVTTAADSEEGLLMALEQELNMLAKDSRFETTLLIHPNVLNDFLDYNDFLGVVDQLLQQMDLDGVFQIASFHPKYQFAGASEDDAENYTNRAPYPLLHILREGSVARVVDAHPNVDEIPLDNIRKMNELGRARLRGIMLKFNTGTD